MSILVLFIGIVLTLIAISDALGKYGTPISVTIASAIGGGLIGVGIMGIIQ